MNVCVAWFRDLYSPKKRHHKMKTRKRAFLFKKMKRDFIIASIALFSRMFYFRPCWDDGGFGHVHTNKFSIIYWFVGDIKLISVSILFQYHVKRNKYFKYCSVKFNGVLIRFCLLISVILVNRIPKICYACGKSSKNRDFNFIKRNENYRRKCEIESKIGQCSNSAHLKSVYNQRQQLMKSWLVT